KEAYYLHHGTIKQNRQLVIFNFNLLFFIVWISYTLHYSTNQNNSCHPYQPVFIKTLLNFFLLANSTTPLYFVHILNNVPGFIYGIFIYNYSKQQKSLQPLRSSTSLLSFQPDLNRRPHPYHGSTLPAELWKHFLYKNSLEI